MSENMGSLNFIPYDITRVFVIFTLFHMFSLQAVCDLIVHAQHH